MTIDKDAPIVPSVGSPLYASQVIDLGDVRVQHGLPRYTKRRCEHKTLVYNSSERRIWCEDCERTIEGFEAFMMMAKYYHAMEADLERKRQKINEALTHSVINRAAKVIDQQWRSRRMVPCCPHCNAAIFPEDVLRGLASVSKEIEIARRKRRTGQP